MAGHHKSLRRRRSPFFLICSLHRQASQRHPPRVQKHYIYNVDILSLTLVPLFQMAASQTISLQQFIDGFEGRIWADVGCYVYLLALHQAVQMVSRGVMEVDSVSAAGDTLLILLVKHEKDLSDIRQVLASGAKVDQRDKGGNSALHHAKSKEVVDVLLEHGASVNVRNLYGRTPLVESLLRIRRVRFLKTSDIEIIGRLLKRGANPNSEDFFHNTPMHYVKDIDVFNILVENGARVARKNRLDVTPLMKMAVTRRCDCMHHCLKYSLLDLEFDSHREIARNRFRNHDYPDICDRVFESMLEIQRMKNSRFPPGITLFDIVKPGGPGMLPPFYIRFSQQHMDQQYPQYKDIIRLALKQCNRQLFRKRLMRLADRIVVSAKDVPCVLNHDCFLHMAQFLSKEDVANVFLASFE